ncbi:TetR/AcrR family transcriptional regulator [Conexibacter sp. CPCC 206217]|uniref:TetR/AcrR family transcriptional regulator n=1 Tax=Conexibacter sp. CPCC 206217 TaxID=3064574 RepID=UPI002719BBB0|nr:TetR/AcrR family transcriptional regulator [Conexibacter sp. CPCC 206217]MDO8213586.1 TetR/AcrR family transcriptional regulator [Conexibacter sp. CPCC 206217]
MARPREFDEQRVLRAAAGVFRRHGYAGASLQELTQATGLGKGSLYGAFGSKHGLYLAALDQYYTPGEGQALDHSGAPAIEELRTYMADAAAGSSDGSPSCLLTSATAELSGRDDPVSQRVNAAFDDISAMLRARVVRGQTDGTIAAEVDPQTAADLLLAVARGIEVLGHAGIERERLVNAAEAAVAALTAE